MHETTQSEDQPVERPDPAIEAGMELLSALFAESDTILFRPIESWTNAGKKKSRVIRGAEKYCSAYPRQLRIALRNLCHTSEAERANIYFGVCPRFGKRGRFDLAWQIRTVRALWSDIDCVTVEEARDRVIKADLAQPSIVVNSGNGVHLYWLLDEPYLIDDVGDPPAVETEWTTTSTGRNRPRKYMEQDGEKVYLDQRRNFFSLSAKAQHMQDVLAGLADVIGGDHTTDLSRLLRVPGTLNRKDQRNDREPVETALIDCWPDRRYALSTFEHLKVVTDKKRSDQYSNSRSIKPRRVCASGREKLEDLIAASASGVLGVRSEADFALCCHAIRHGILKDEVWGRVEQVGKFAEEGLRYFEHTWAKAEEAAWSDRTPEEHSAQAGVVSPEVGPLSGLVGSVSDSPRGNVAQGEMSQGADLEIDISAPQYRTETAQARRVAERYGHEIRWVDPWGKWLIWDRKQWRIDDERFVDQAVKKVADDVMEEAKWLVETASGDSGAEAAARAAMSYARAVNSAFGVRNVTALMRSEPGVPIRHDSLDAHPMLLNVRNGTLDLRTGELRPHRREDLLTKLVDVEYREDAICPTWRKFLTEVFEGNGDLIGFIRRAAGYSLTASTNERCLFFLHGEGKNGKTTMVSTLQKMLGDYATPVTTEMLMMQRGNQHPTELTDLAGRRMAVASETEDGRRMAESFVKQITGGEDVLKARRMREDFWSFYPTHKLWVSGNHKPKIRGTDDGIWDRMRLIPFAVRFENPDRTLPQRLKSEWPGILAWAVAGCLEWQAGGLGEPEVVRKATETYRREMDTVGQFLEEYCSFDPAAVVRASDLFTAYTQWCEGAGDRPVGSKTFGKQLNNLEIPTGRESGTGKTTRVGITLKGGSL